MNFFETPLKGLYEIDLNVFKDDRGWFARTYCKNEFEQIGHQNEWVQINHSFTAKKGTVRGMHFQMPPYSEIKMIRCISGTVYDVAIDLRNDSATFLKWYGIILSQENKKMIYIPQGFAHGFQALTDDCELIYHHSAFYQPGVEQGIRFDDECIDIKWPLRPAFLSKRDLDFPLINKDFQGITL